MQKLDATKFKIRASACGQIMTEPKGKSPMQKFLDMKEQVDRNEEKYNAMNQETKTAEKLLDNLWRWKEDLVQLEKHKDNVLLSATCIAHLKDWARSILYSRKKEIISKYLSKGMIMEDMGLDMISDHLDLGMVVKNEQWFSNKFMTGTPDLDLPKLVIDDKNSWDVFTFPILETEIPDNDYYWQLQTYMALMDKPKAILAYTLTDMPQHLIESEARRYCYQYGYDEVTEDILKQFKQRYTYEDIPAKLKVKIFEVERHDDNIKRIERRVVDCRNYLSDMLKELPE